MTFEEKVTTHFDSFQRGNLTQDELIAYVTAIAEEEREYVLNLIWSESQPHTSQWVTSEGKPFYTPELKTHSSRSVGGI